MNLQIRHPRARSLARRLADLRGITMTDAVVEALEAEVARAEAGPADLHARLDAIGESLRKKGRPGGRDLTKEERDELWTDAV